MPLGAWAVPSLQLGITPGSYDSTSQTTIASTAQASLIALVDPLGTGINVTESFYISAAIVPRLEPNSATRPSPDLNFGSFSIEGTTYSLANNNILYGIPPVEANWTADRDPGDLSAHGIFYTYYAEVGFNLDLSLSGQVQAYNVQTGASASGVLYRKTFAIDVSGLSAGYAVHFDLYNSAVRRNDTDIGRFAPFSHDAQSVTMTLVPDGGTTLLLLGLSLVGLRCVSRKRG
jgi:hypothetical protein